MTGTGQPFSLDYQSCFFLASEREEAAADPSAWLIRAVEAGKLVGEVEKKGGDL
jgi:hypothetical protein